MNFANIRQNLKTKKMPVVQVVIASLFFILISDKGLFNNFSSFIQNIHVTSPEAFISGMFNFGKFISLQYSIVFGLSYMFFELTKLVAIAIALLAIIKYLVGFERIEEKKIEVASASDRFHTNDIYLQTSKFIC